MAVKFLLLSLALDILPMLLVSLPALLPQRDQTRLSLCLAQLRSSRKCQRQVVEEESTFTCAHLDEALRCFSIVDEEKCGLFLSRGKLELRRRFSGCVQHRPQMERDVVNSSEVCSPSEELTWHYRYLLCAQDLAALAKMENLCTTLSSFDATCLMGEHFKSCYPVGSFERTLEELDLGAYFLQTLVDENGQHLPGAHECPFFSKRGINKDLKFAPFVKSRSVITKTGQQRFSLDVSDVVESLKGYNKPGTLEDRIVSMLEDEKRRAKKYDEAKENTLGKANESASSSVLRREGAADSRLEDDSPRCSSACDSMDSGGNSSNNNDDDDILQVMNEYHDNYPDLQKALKDSEQLKDDLSKEAEDEEEEEEEHLEKNAYPEILTVAGSVAAAVVILFLFILSLMLVVKTRRRQQAADGRRDSGKHFEKK